MEWVYINDEPHTVAPKALNIRITESAEHTQGITVSYKRIFTLEMLTVEHGWRPIGTRYFYHQNNQSYETQNMRRASELTNELRNYAAYLFEGTVMPRSH